MWSEIVALYGESKKKKDINWITEWVARPPAAVVVYALRNTSITPNQLTFLSAFVAAGRPPAPGAPAAPPAPPAWKVENGYLEAVPRGGSIRTKESFGDIQLHAEWAAPNPPMLTGQNRGNSGIILMGQYEIQVLDSYGRTDTYADGTAGSTRTSMVPPQARPTSQASSSLMP